MPSSVFIDFATDQTSVGVVADGSVGAPTLTFAADPLLGFYRIGTNNQGAASNGAAAWDWNTTRLNLASGYALSFNAGAQLIDEGANIVGMRNGTNAQLISVYRTFTSSSVFERLEVGINAALVGGANSFSLLSTSTGGTVRPLVLGTNGNATLFLVVQGGTATGWQIAGASGNLLAGADNTLDIGATAANRPRNIFAGTRVTAPAYTVGSTTGASGTGTVLTQLTVVNGIVTSITIS